MGRAKAKKEQEIWKAVAKDMKGNKIDPRTGRVVPKKRKPPTPSNRRSGTDYVGR